MSILRLLFLFACLFTAAFTLIGSAQATPRFLDVPIIQAGGNWNPDLPAQQGSVAAGPDGDFHLAYWLFDTGEVYYRNWSIEKGLRDPIRIATPLDQLSAPPSIAVDPRGTVHIVFVSNKKVLSYATRPRNGSFQGGGLVQNNWRIAQPSLAVGGTLQHPRVGIVYLARRHDDPSALDAYEVIYAEKNNPALANSPWTSKVIDTTPAASYSPVAALEQTTQQTVTVAYVTSSDLGYKLQSRRGSAFDSGTWTTRFIEETDDPRGFDSTISLHVFPDAPGQAEVGFSLHDKAIVRESSALNREWFFSRGLRCSSFAGNSSFEVDGDILGLDTDWEVSGACRLDADLLDNTLFLRSGEDMHIVHVRFESTGQSPNEKVAYYIPPGHSVPVDQATVIAHPLGNRTLLARAAVNNEGRIAILHGRKTGDNQPEMIMSVLVFDEDDMDQDGATALYEDAMGTSDTNPNDSDRWAVFLDTAEIFTGVPPFLIRKEVPAMAFQRLTTATVNVDGSFLNAAGVRCIPEVTTDMNTWIGGDALLEITDTFPNFLRPGWEFVRYAWPNGNVPDRVFFRLRVENP